MQTVVSHPVLHVIFSNAFIYESFEHAKMTGCHYGNFDDLTYMHSQVID